MKIKSLINRNILSSRSYLNTRIQHPFSTLNLIKERDNQFRSLLLSQETLTTNELSNIARVLRKNRDVKVEEEKKFDEQALALTKKLDTEELRQVINYYVTLEKENKFVFYEINQRYQQVAPKDYTNELIKSDCIQVKTWLSIFQLRNRLFRCFSNKTGILLK